jgi:RND family efflux transporter MFP subunit
LNEMLAPIEVPPREAAEAPIDHAKERRLRRGGWLFGLGAIAGLALLVGIGAHSRGKRIAAAAAALAAQRDAVPVVRTAVLEALNTPHEIELPGSTQAFDTATLFARATGYVAVRNVDIGSRVHKGDLLALVAAPDLDQQLAQARAELVQLEANVLQTQASAKMAYDKAWRTMQTAKDGWTPQQQADVDRDSLAADDAGVAVARANVLAQQAQVGRLEQLTGFERVIAPFDGVITSRQVDVGSLATANENSGTPLFSIAHTDVLRVQIYVPQDDYFAMRDGDEAEVRVPELPGRVFRGKLARNASALQPDTRTVLAEVDVQNAEGALAPGVYAIVQLHEPRRYPVISVPSKALVFDKNGPQAAVFDNGVIHLRRLDIAADNGATVEVRDGLHAGEQLVLTPPIGATDGMRATRASSQVR